MKIIIVPNVSTEPTVYKPSHCRSCGLIQTLNISEKLCIYRLYFSVKLIIYIYINVSCNAGSVCMYTV